MNNEKHINTLDVSPRTVEFLDGLGVKTVGELLALPEIRAPKMVAAEIRLLLEELGIHYPKEIILDVPRVVSATGDLAERWRTITAWLEEHHPHLLKVFCPPVSAQTICATEDALGHTLPEDYKRFMLLHNGQTDMAPMVGTCSLLQMQQLASEYKSLHDLYQSEGSIDEDLAGEGVRPVECAAGWIPIARSARGRDFLCIDLDPTEGGQRGQIIQLSVDFEDRPCVAASFADLLSIFFEQLQTGEIDFEEEI